MKNHVLPILKHLNVKAHSVVTIAIYVGVLPCFFETAIASDPEPTLLPEKVLAPFFNNYCVSCHGGEDPSGQVRLEHPIWKVASNDSAQRWQDLLDVLNSGDMPPEDADQPDPEELQAVLRSLTKSLGVARRRLTEHGGEIAMRRLNRREYAATIRELFHFRILPKQLPPDAESDSFDTVGADQFFASSHFDQYFELAKVIVKDGFDWAARPHAKMATKRNDPEDKITKRMRDSLKDHQNKLAMIAEGKSYQEIGFEDEGQMNIFVKRSKAKKNSQRYLELPRVDEGQYLAPDNGTKRLTFPFGADPRAEYRLRIHGGVRPGQVPLRHYVKVQNAEDVKVLKILGTEDNPQTVEINIKKRLTESGKINLLIMALQNQNNKIDRKGDWAAIWVDYMEMVGPFYQAERSFFDQLVFPEPPIDGDRDSFKLVWKDKDAEKLIRRFALKAFRGAKPSPEYVKQLVALFVENREAGLKFGDAMVEPLAIVLCSPQFLYVQEAQHAGTGQHFLSDRELATRLSYFLWSCPPDEELLELASSGELSSESVLRRQVNRMLDDPKSEEFFEGFVSQWADLDRFDAITVDEKEFARFNVGLRQSARREVVEFFKVLVAEDLPAENLIDSDFIVVDPLLENHYELDKLKRVSLRRDNLFPKKNGFRKISLPADSVRGGLLGQTAFLTLGSNGERSSPVIRGAWVMEKLLHDPPSPPPPNVPELGSDSKKPRSNREMVIMHQKQTVCASCHKSMDVIGFGLENFDTIGRWRKTEQVGKKQVPIESGGKLPSGVSFNDVSELKALLLTQKHRLALELCESITAYGIGRDIEFSDADVIQTILKKNQSQDFRLRSMIAEIVTSDLFKTK